MMNNEDFVTYEQAQKLKELGFDWECDYLYNADKELIKYDYHQEFYDEQLYSNCIPVPTLYQSQKWLRDVHKLDCNASCDPYRLEWYWYVSSTTEINEMLFSEEDFYNTYEEAASIGIDEALKLLKTENNGK